MPRCMHALGRIPRTAHTSIGARCMCMTHHSLDQFNHARFALAVAGWFQVAVAGWGFPRAPDSSDLVVVRKALALMDIAVDPWSMQPIGEMKSYCGFLRSPHFTVYVSSSARSRAPACQFCKKPLCSLEIATKSRSSPNSLSVNPLAPLLLPSPSRVPPPPPPPLHSSLRLPPPHPCVFSTASDAPRRRLSNAPPRQLSLLPLPRGGSPRALSVVAARSGAAFHVRALRHPPRRVEADTPG
jgi:hypothetical protein